MAATPPKCLSMFSYGFYSAFSALSSPVSDASRWRAFADIGTFKRVCRHFRHCGDRRKALFAQSSIAQLGYMAIGLGIMTSAGIASFIHLFNHADEQHCFSRLGRLPRDNSLSSVIGVPDGKSPRP